MGPVCESLRLYNLCKGMDWNHLPVAGGIYDQHPKLIDDFQVIMHIDAKVQQEKDKKRQREQGKPGGRAASRRRGR